MSRVPMSEAEATHLLETCELLRVSFHDGDDPYLIPLGCVWHDGALYGVTEAGRKTEMAARNARVAFQTDTALRTGLFEWESVTGQGRFEVVSDPAEIRQAMAKLQPFVAAAPEWWRNEQGPRMAAGELLVWRIRPRTYTGARYVRPA